MFEERNVYMTEKFVKLSNDLNFTFFDNENRSLMTCIELGAFVTGEYKPIYFCPPNFVSESDSIYCDVEGYTNTNIKKFYDTEYLFDVEKTYQMKSKAHKNMKHNVNILSNRLDSRYGGDYEFVNGDFADIQEIHDEWIKTDITFEVNNMLMIQLIYNHIDAFATMNRKVLRIEGEPIGFILYDESPSYTHVFFSYAIPSVEYAHDYMMWRFFRQLYQNATRKNSIKLVNFGGVYGDSNIKKEKDRLCPYVVRDRWSWSG